MGKPLSCFAGRTFFSWTEDQLISVPIPSTEWLGDLDGGIGEAWPTGADSIEHPGSPNIRFFLWAGTFWTALSDVIEEQKEWRRAREWIDGLVWGRKTREVQAGFCRIPRNTPVRVLTTETERAGTSISFYVKILSDKLLTERRIDAFAVYLNIQVCVCQPSTPRVFIADLSLSATPSYYFNNLSGWQGPDCVPEVWRAFGATPGGHQGV